MRLKESEPEQSDTAPSLSDHIDQNIAQIAELQRREWELVTPSQRRVERLSRFIARPIYLVVLVALIVAWTVFNVAARHTNGAWDPPPFELLDGIMTFLSLITTTIVLIAQIRQTKREQQHTHLDLQVNLLTEQKVSKLIHLIEELRRDLPMVKDRHDPHSSALQEQANTSDVLSAIEQVGLTNVSEEDIKPGEPKT